MLVKSIDHVEQKFEKYAAAIIEVSDAGRLVGNDVVNFYKKKESRHASARYLPLKEKKMRFLSKFTKIALKLLFT